MYEFGQLVYESERFYIMYVYCTLRKRSKNSITCFGMAFATYKLRFDCKAISSRCSLTIWG